MPNKNLVVTIKVAYLSVNCFWLIMVWLDGSIFAYFPLAPHMAPSSVSNLKTSHTFEISWTMALVLTPLPHLWVVKYSG